MISGTEMLLSAHWTRISAVSGRDSRSFEATNRHTAPSSCRWSFFTLVTLRKRSSRFMASGNTSS